MAFVPSVIIWMPSGHPSDHTWDKCHVLDVTVLQSLHVHSMHRGNVTHTNQLILLIVLIIPQMRTKEKQRYEGKVKKKTKQKLAQKGKQTIQYTRQGKQNPEKRRKKQNQTEQTN